MSKLPESKAIWLNNLWGAVLGGLHYRTQSAYFSSLSQDPHPPCPVRLMLLQIVSNMSPHSEGLLVRLGEILLLQRGRINVARRMEINKRIYETY